MEISSNPTSLQHVVPNLFVRGDLTHKLSLVDQSELDKNVTDVPLDNLMEVYKVCSQMEVICEKEQGVGLAATQVGIPWRLFIVKADENSLFDLPGKYGYFINCDYVNVDENYIMSLEGCLSIRSPSGRLRQFQVKRYKEIIINGMKLKVTYNGLELHILENVVVDTQHQNVIFQHEIGHSRGELISEIGKEVFLWK